MVSFNMSSGIIFFIISDMGAKRISLIWGWGEILNSILGELNKFKFYR